jgi:hypothetical protein
LSFEQTKPPPEVKDGALDGRDVQQGVIRGEMTICSWLHAAGAQAQPRQATVWAHAASSRSVSGWIELRVRQMRMKIFFLYIQWSMSQ